jgi:hypothetical protein
MYRVRREASRIEVIRNGSGGIVYSAGPDEYIVFRESDDAPKNTVKKVRELADDELLLALANVVIIDLPGQPDPREGK